MWLVPPLPATWQKGREKNSCKEMQLTVSKLIMGDWYKYILIF